MSRYALYFGQKDCITVVLLTGGFLLNITCLKTGLHWKYSGIR